eukprot:m.36502 g.36502  ORF g.36502 m.36502 type:complete len:159 (+) comp9128_c0_seq1:174-650(+)
MKNLFSLLPIVVVVIALCNPILCASLKKKETTLTATSTVTTERPTRRSVTTTNTASLASEFKTDAQANEDHRMMFIALFGLGVFLFFVIVVYAGKNKKKARHDIPMQPIQLEEQADDGLQDEQDLTVANADDGHLPPEPEHNRVHLVGETNFQEISLD